MGKVTNIAWCDSSWNPWIGCTQVGPGCKFCYAESLDKRYGHAHWGPGAPRRRTSEENWKLPLRWNRIAFNTGTRPWVFCASMADVFDNEVPPEWRTDMWALIRATPNLNWQIVTKRISNVKKMVPENWPYPHVGIIATVCTQAEADRDIPRLLNTPAAWHGLSVEPMLEAIDMRRLLTWGATVNDFHHPEPGIDWVIIGGESGPKARPFSIPAARDLVAQCRAADVPVFMKQIGRRPIFGTKIAKYNPHDRDGRDLESLPVDLRIRQMPRVSFGAPQQLELA